jgi:regulatory protein
VPDTPDPIELAARALRRRDRSRRQIDERLARAGVEEERREDALETLERIGYVDDARFAARRAAALAERGYGNEGIRRLLEADGLPPSEIEAAVAGLAPERARADAVVARAGAMARTAAQLLRKGFDADTVEAAVGGGFADREPEA